MEENKNEQYDHQKELFEQLGITLDAFTIHQKDFQIKFRGYDPDEVDAFLDDIIKDYSQFYAVISDLLEKYKELKLQERANKISMMHRERDESLNKGPSVDVKFIEDIVRKMEQNITELKYRMTIERETEKDM
ncbi:MULTISPECIES: DivIVA domain-containing protein [Paenibacillus]|uniref:DivIVA domain-containing protein n=1 Tax=Paenibacillus alvei TaxID=44250 RepID=A0AAP6ZWU7_PAEAL|nr:MULTISPECIES: DivIVA domain-containing protein [Paenibacillus]EJW16209.1 hypothetical protein PAV_6c02900 [Paenibacillus alvei DSM 29]MEC0079617.1 DivIVA domain-containing protein [Paenibacillus alvei]NOJ70109.1 DivIVA domain-containing protein [Paenibacillus alvei]